MKIPTGAPAAHSSDAKKSAAQQKDRRGAGGFHSVLSAASREPGLASQPPAAASPAPRLRRASTADEALVLQRAGTAPSVPHTLNIGTKPQNLHHATAKVAAATTSTAGTHAAKALHPAEPAAATQAEKRVEPAERSKTKRAEPVEELTKQQAAPTPKFEDVTKPPPSPAQIAPPTVVPQSFAASLPQGVLDDPTLRVVLMPRVARVSVETADAGPLSLQVRVTDGVADVRAVGAAAPLLEHRQDDLRVAFAKEGLALGHFDLTQSNSGSQHSRPERADELPTVRPTKKSDAAADDHEDGVHVRA